MKNILFNIFNFQSGILYFIFISILFAPGKLLLYDKRKKRHKTTNNPEIQYNAESMVLQ
jgi:hypothetical protein